MSRIHVENKIKLICIISLKVVPHQEQKICNHALKFES